MKAAGGMRPREQMTDLEAEWIRVHVLIDRGFSYCSSCHRIVEPVRIQTQHLLDFGETMRGVFGGKRNEYRSPHCPHCGARLAKRDRESAESRRCSPCGRDWTENYKHCPLCGLDLARDPAVVLSKAAEKADDERAWKEYMELFDGYFNSSSITPEMCQRLEDLSAGTNKQTSRAWMQLMADGGAEEAN